MAIPSIPNKFYCQTANAQVYLSWDLTTGATSYSVQRSTDGITYTTVSSPTSPEYLDAAVTPATKYWYQVAAVNVSGTGSYTTPQAIIPAPVGEMSLGQIRLLSQMKADRVGSNFVTLPEWNSFINLAMYELYDLLVTTYDEYFLAPTTVLTTDGSSARYPLPDGIRQFKDANGALFTPPALFKLRGVDLAINSVTNNAYVTLSKFNFENRNKFVYPNSSSTMYGVFNMQYRLMGNNLEFIPTPAAGQQIRLWFIPKLTELLKDTDCSSVSISGWIAYVIARAAKYALDKEESASDHLTQEIVYFKGRIEETAANRDAGRPDTIADVRGWDTMNNMDFFKGGW